MCGISCALHTTIYPTNFAVPPLSPLFVANNAGRFFKNLKITPSLLHGNLWSRNWGVDYSGKPVIYDPAVYFGHYEMEMSMLTMFGSPCKGEVQVAGAFRPTRNV